MKKELQRRLAVIFTNDPPYRYVPRALPDRPIGGLGWEVFDRKENRFLKNSQIMGLSFEDCIEKLVN